MDTQIEVADTHEAGAAGGGALERGGAAAMWAEMVEGRRRLVADVIDGRADEIDVDDLALAVELDVRLTHSDHMRLLRAASLAIQYRGRTRRAAPRRRSSGGWRSRSGSTPPSSGPTRSSWSERSATARRPGRARSATCRA